MHWLSLRKIVFENSMFALILYLIIFQLDRKAAPHSELRIQLPFSSLLIIFYQEIIPLLTNLVSLLVTTAHFYHFPLQLPHLNL